jgi:tRNA(His) guanylyltransferase
MSKGKDEFGDRMKEYEMVEAGRRFIPLLPVIARLDGCNFSSFTKGFARPYDDRMMGLMTETAKHLVDFTHACCAYTQSDELSLVFYSDTIKSQIFLGGRIQKMTSRLAARASSHFTRLLPEYIPERANAIIEFDCRCWVLPNLQEAINTLIWREIDCTKNSVSMVCREYYSHKQMDGLGRADQMDLLMAKGINWDKYPDRFKRGTYIQRKKSIRKFTPQELEDLPEKHEARINPNLEVERSDVVIISMPPLTKVINKEGVIFRGEDPVTEKT